MTDPMCGCYGCKHDIVDDDPESWAEGVCHVSGIDCLHLQCEDCKEEIKRLRCYEKKEA